MAKYYIMYVLISSLEKFYVEAESKEEAIKKFRAERGTIPYIYRIYVWDPVEKNYISCR